MDKWYKYIKDFKFDTDNYKSHYVDKLKEDIMADKYRNKNRLSPEDRARFARERRELVGSILTQKSFEGALVLEHIRGSQYLVRMPDGTEVYASHKKQRNQESSISAAGWTRWQERR